MCCAQNRHDSSSLSRIAGHKIICEPPNNQLYRFEGSIEDTAAAIKHTINNDNVMLRGTTLRNTKFVIGVATYTGLDTKLMRTYTLQ